MITCNRPTLKSSRDALLRNIWVNAVCGIVILSWVLMVNLAVIAQTLITKGTAGELWTIIGQLADPPVKLWSVLLIPSSLAISIVVLFDTSGRLLKWYVIAASGIILMLAFTILRYLLWGTSAFPLLSSR